LVAAHIFFSSVKKGGEIMIVNVGGPMARGRGARGLREYQTGTYPVPGWGYAPVPPAAPCCGKMSKRKANRMVNARLHALGYIGPYDASLADAPDTTPSIATSTGSVPTAVYDPAIWVGGGQNSNITAPPAVGIYNVSSGGGQLTSAQLAQISQLTAAAAGNQPLPAVSPATLLAAAALPGAPAAVKTAAAAYSSANPLSSFLSGTIFGLPSYMVLGGSLLAVVLFASGAGRSRR
jgi:hypothetical protein